MGGRVPRSLSILRHSTAVVPGLALGEVYEGWLALDLLAHWCKVSGTLGVGEDVRYFQIRRGLEPGATTDMPVASKPAEFCSATAAAHAGTMQPRQPIIQAHPMQGHPMFEM